MIDVGAMEALVAEGGEADALLREAVRILASGVPFVAIEFVEEGGIVGGPRAGEETAAVERVPVLYDGTRVADLVAGGAAAADFEALGRCAELLAPWCLVGWDMGGEPWEP